MESGPSLLRPHRQAIPFAKEPGRAVSSAEKKGPDMTERAIQKIVYCFGDASVPPEFHRSYKIVVTQDMVTVTVDSYGEVLAKKTHGITKEQFGGIVESLRRNGIRHISPKEIAPGFTGGTSETISFWDGEEEIFSGTVYHCGGVDAGNLGGNTRDFADDVRRLVPDLESLLDTTE